MNKILTKNKISNIFKFLTYFLFLGIATEDGLTQLYRSFYIEKDIGIVSFVPYKKVFESDGRGKSYFVYYKYKTFIIKKRYSGSVGFGGKNVSSYIKNKRKLYKRIYLTNINKKNEYLIIDKNFNSLISYQIYLVKRIFLLLLFIVTIIYIDSFLRKNEIKEIK